MECDPEKAAKFPGRTTRSHKPTFRDRGEPRLFVPKNMLHTTSLSPTPATSIGTLREHDLARSQRDYGRTFFAIVERMPFTKRPDSSVEKVFANSTASFNTTAVGTSERLINS